MLFIVSNAGVKALMIRPGYVLHFLDFLYVPRQIPCPLCKRFVLACSSDLDQARRRVSLRLLEWSLWMCWPLLETL